VAATGPPQGCLAIGRAILGPLICSTLRQSPSEHQRQRRASSKLVRAVPCLAAGGPCRALASRRANARRRTAAETARASLPPTAVLHQIQRATAPASACPERGLFIPPRAARSTNHRGRERSRRLLFFWSSPSLAPAVRSVFFAAAPPIGLAGWHSTARRG